MYVRSTDKIKQKEMSVFERSGYTSWDTWLLKIENWWIGWVLSSIKDLVPYSPPHLLSPLQHIVPQHLVNHWWCYIKGVLYSNVVPNTLQQNTVCLSGLSVTEWHICVLYQKPLLLLWRKYVGLHQQVLRFVVISPYYLLNKSFMFMHKEMACF